MHNIKLIIAYDGTHYMGWQKTSTGPSIELNLQQVLEQIFQQPIVLQAASRTDRGVHAYGQVVNFLLQKPLKDLDKLKISINALLPKEIIVLEVDEKPLQFHPTLDCKAKEYRYYICFDKVQLPFQRLYSWHVHYPEMDLEKMREASVLFMGEHSFTSFCNKKKNAKYKDYVRNITSIEIIEIEYRRLCITIKGNNFLYKMVRNIVGTLVYIGIGKILIEDINGILNSHDRTQSGVTAPAHGLFLHKVFY